MSVKSAVAIQITDGKGSKVFRSNRLQHQIRQFRECSNLKNITSMDLTTS